MKNEASGDDGQGGEPSAERELETIRRTTRRRAARLVALLVLVVILVAFVIENSARVKINFVFFSREVRPIWLMLTSAVLGGIVGFLAGRPGKQVRFRPGKDGKEPKR